jgi:DNA-binding response OmpR family regulator
MKSKGSVLIIEDDEILADVYATKLKLECYEVLLATDGVRGLHEAVRKKPDLILLDVVLPKLNGFEILKQIRQRRDTKNIPVVVLSNLGQDYEVKRGMTLGADKYLVKANYTPAEVVDVVKEVLKDVRG